MEGNRAFPEWESCYLALWCNSSSPTLLLLRLLEGGANEFPNDPPPPPPEAPPPPLLAPLKEGERPLTTFGGGVKLWDRAPLEAPEGIPGKGGGVRLWRWCLGGGGGSKGEFGSFGANRGEGLKALAPPPPPPVGVVTRSGGRRGKSLGSRGSMKVVLLAVWSMKNIWKQKSGNYRNVTNILLKILSGQHRSKHFITSFFYC